MISVSTFVDTLTLRSYDQNVINVGRTSSGSGG